MTQGTEGGRCVRSPGSCASDSCTSGSCRSASCAVSRAISVIAVAAMLATAALTDGRPGTGVPRLVTGPDLPSEGRLLWLDGRSVVAGERAVAARDSSGRVFLIDDHLEVREAALPGDVASTVSVAPADGEGGLWLVDGRGRLLRVTSRGAVAAEVPTPYALASLGGSTAGGVILLTRSVEAFPFVPDTAPEAPVVLVDSAGRVLERLGAAARPEQALLADLANAGYVRRVGDRTVFAPFIRDEVVAFGPRGDTLWSLRRGLVQETPEPRFLLEDGRPVLDYFPVNLGLEVGPDGRVYVLSTEDTTVTRSRLDVLDAGSGQLLETLHLETAFPTIVVTRRGTVHLVSSSELLARGRAAARPLVPSFDWPRPNGEVVTEGVLQGRVTLINVWASWCAPCRQEMPELVRLWESLADSGLAFLAVNEDVKPENARRWLAEIGLAPPVALAGGRAGETLHYPGLPYTMLVDQQGRIVRRWIGYLGSQQIGAVRAAARRELSLGSSHHHHAATAEGTHHSGH